jgi:16S rRNA (adenine1518-N6/adenine1519-N6)-dimethyltransferase
VLDARALLREAGLTAKKSFGQNFLVAEPVVRAIARLCVADDEVKRAVVVELGAGLGALTSELVERAQRVVAVERDRDLVPVLQNALAASIDAGVLQVEEADAQSIDVPALLGPAGDTVRVLAGNLPYQITGRLLEGAVHAASGIDRAVFMVQEEVADRLVARPGTKAYGALSVFVQAAFAVKKEMVVSRGCFHPAPEVTSAVVRLTALRPARAEETPTFQAVVKGAFAMRRKTLRNAWRGLASEEALAAAAATAGVSLDDRGEVLDVDAFARMARALGTEGRSA